MVEVYLLIRGRRADERHVVEGRHEDATVEGVEVEERLQLYVVYGRRLSPEELPNSVRAHGAPFGPLIGILICTDGYLS